MRALNVLLASPPDFEPVASYEVWRQRNAAAASLAASPFEHAILGGFSADRVGYAFASGYQAGLRALVPDLPPEGVASLCVTERDGARPRAIETRLSPAEGGGYLLSGKKRWATLSRRAGLLLVVASVGVDASGKNRLRVARVDASANGVKRTPMPETPFAPEIPHDEIELSNVRVAEADLCPGDGYASYVKPFRTIEDIYVYAAVMAYLVREVRLHELPHAFAERLAAVIVALGALAELDPSAPENHVALAGVLALQRASLEEIGRFWARTESPAHARWERDRVLFTVGSDARQQRLVRAWERLAPGGADDESSSVR
jgi:alkylation response protein AidB-like acyl-CoA dehydrogenase